MDRNYFSDFLSYLLWSWRGDIQVLLTLDFHSSAMFSSFIGLFRNSGNGLMLILKNILCTELSRESNENCLPLRHRSPRVRRWGATTTRKSSIKNTYVGTRFRSQVGIPWTTFVLSDLLGLILVSLYNWLNQCVHGDRTDSSFSKISLFWLYISQNRTMNQNHLHEVFYMKLVVTQNNPLE